MAAHSITVAIPALNEERNISSAIGSVMSAAAKVPDLAIEVLVIDDGSSDGTAEITKRISERDGRIRLLQNGTNLGLGASIRRAIEEARTEKLMIVPGDNDIPAATLELLLRNAYLADIVMCYFLDDELRGRIRFIVSNTFMLIYTTVFDLYVQYINGPAVYPVSGLRKLNLHSTRFSIVAEINVKLLRQGATFAEMPSFRQMGLHRSRSFTMKSLAESARVFFQIIMDVYFRDPQAYSARPTRVPYRIQAAGAAEMESKEIALPKHG